MKFITRQGNEEDYAAIFSLLKDFATFQKTPEKLLITPQQLKEDKDFFRCFVAEDAQQQIVGFASYFFAYYSWSGRAVYLDDLYVKPTARGQGIGTLLLKALVDYAKKEDCKKVRWQVSKWNNEAINFYKKMGAVTDDIEINCDLVLV
ncbi:MAG: family N-acetyltransferase [Segetibacter sp.]|nr:family N-acetyltransferase [Segetibacter sp.]